MNIDTSNELTPEVWRAALAVMPDSTYANLRGVIAELDAAEYGDAEQSGGVTVDAINAELAKHGADLIPVPRGTLEAYRELVTDYAARLDGWCAELAQQGFDVDRTGALSVTVKRPAP